MRRSINRQPIRVRPASNRRPLLGVFDSGLGGLTVLRRLRELAPDVDLLYFADQRHVPYGDREPGDLRRLLASNVEFLAGEGVDAIVMGCNTSCAIAARYGWPPSRVPILDLIAAAADAVAAARARRVGVIATTATARSGAYAAAIAARAPGTLVREVAAPALVPLVEAGIVSGPLARDAVAAACRELGEAPDAVVLACTHYPLLDREFAAVLGGSVARIDPARVQADRAVGWVRERFGLRVASEGNVRYVTSGALPAFRDGVARIAGSLGAGDVVEIRDSGVAEVVR